MLVISFIHLKTNSKKIFEGEMLTTFNPTNLLQIVYEVMINFEVIFKSLTGPDNKSQGNLKA